MPAPLRLTIAVRSHGHTRALKDGTVTMTGIEFQFIEVEPQIAAFRRMVRDVEFDVCELAPTTYFIAKGYGAVYTALPRITSTGRWMLMILILFGTPRPMNLR